MYVWCSLRAVICDVEYSTRYRNTYLGRKPSRVRYEPGRPRLCGNSLQATRGSIFRNFDVKFDTEKGPAPRLSHFLHVYICTVPQLYAIQFFWAIIKSLQVSENKMKVRANGEIG